LTYSGREEVHKKVPWSSPTIPSSSWQDPHQQKSSPAMQTAKRNGSSRQKGGRKRRTQLISPKEFVINFIAQLPATAIRRHFVLGKTKILKTI